MSTTRLTLTRSQVLAFRRHVGALDSCLPHSSSSLQRAAWAGLQDSMPRAALLSIHARVEATAPDALDDPALVQIWGPRHSVFVVAARDIALFTLGVHPDDPIGRRRADDLAERVRAHVGTTPASYADVGHALGVHPNTLRYAATTGTVLLRWDGARRPTIRSVPPPTMDPGDARLELARRYLHIYGPATGVSFARWAGLRPAQGLAAFAALQTTLAPVRTPVGDAWILATDEETVRGGGREPAPARLLPSGDPYILLHGADRELLLPDAAQRGALWTSRVWPGALLVDGRVVGTWRRSQAVLTVQTWGPTTTQARRAVEAEAAALPLPGVERPIAVRWENT